MVQSRPPGDWGAAYRRLVCEEKTGKNYPRLSKISAPGDVCQAIRLDRQGMSLATWQKVLDMVRCCIIRLISPED